MEKNAKPFSKTQIILRPSSKLLKIVVILLIVFSTVALIALRWVTNSIRSETENKRGEAAAIEQDNRELETKIDELGSMSSVKDIAQSELDLVDPDTIVIDPE